MSGPAAETTDNTPDFESQAKEMGWVGKDQFRGDESKWIDAKEFVERGEAYLPIVRAQNKRMKQDLLTRDTEIASLKQTLDTVQKSVKSLEGHYTQALKKEVDQAKSELIGQIKVAREAGDTDLEFLLQDKLGDLREAQREAGKVEPEVKPANDGKDALNPVFVAWNKENPWFADTSSAENRKRTKAFIRIGEDLREEGEKAEGADFLNRCLEELEKQEAGTNAPPTKRATSKVEGGNSGGRGSSSRGFDSLPKEAKDACHSDNSRFVGDGKLFKTVKEWEDSFFDQYSSQD